MAVNPFKEIQTGGVAYLHHHIFIKNNLDSRVSVAARTLLSEKQEISAIFQGERVRCLIDNPLGKQLEFSIERAKDGTLRIQRDKASASFNTLSQCYAVEIGHNIVVKNKLDYDGILVEAVLDDPGQERLIITSIGGEHEGEAVTMWDMADFMDLPKQQVFVIGLDEEGLCIFPP